MSTIKENNLIIIALYMGAVVCNDYKTSKLLDFGEKGIGIYPDEWSRFHADTCLKYDKQWNWIIPVYQKIMIDEFVPDKCKMMLKLELADPTTTIEELCSNILTVLTK